MISIGSQLTFEEQTKRPGSQKPSKRLSEGKLGEKRGGGERAESGGREGGQEGRMDRRRAGQSQNQQTSPGQPFEGVHQG